MQDSIHDDRPRFAVVGGGFSGIAAAFWLRRLGARVTIIDEGDALGGRSASVPLGDREVTLGGKNIGRRYSLFRDWAADVGDVAWEPFGINSSRVENGRIATYDSSRRAPAAAHLLRILGPVDAVRLAPMVAAVRRDERNRYLGGPWFTEQAARRGDPAVAGCFGAPFGGAIVRPMTVRMNGAEPGEIHLSSFGTNLGMLLDSYEQPTAGMASLLRDFAAAGDVRLRTRVRSLLADAGGVRGVVAEGPGGAPEELRYDGVVVAVPAHAAAPLLDPVDPVLARDLRSVRYRPAAVVVAEYEHDVFTPEVRALVFGPDSPLSNAGAYGVEERNVVRYTFSGGAAAGLLASGHDPEQLLDTGERLLAPHFPVDRAGRRRFADARWEGAYCAYARDMPALLGRLAGGAAAVRGLDLAGDYLRGASIEACFRSGREAAERAMAAPRLASVALAAGGVHAS